MIIEYIRKGINLIFKQKLEIRDFKTLRQLEIQRKSYENDTRRLLGNLCQYSLNLLKQHTGNNIFCTVYCYIEGKKLYFIGDINDSIGNICCGIHESKNVCMTKVAKICDKMFVLGLCKNL